MSFPLGFMRVFPVLLALMAAGLAQDQPPAGKKPVMETPSMRLASARNVFIYRSRGNTIPLEVIQSRMEGWGRFTLVDTPGKADLLIEISSSGDSGVQVSHSSQVSPESGRDEKSSTSRKDLSPTDIKMTVTDARNKRPLWSASESVKFAMKEKAKENNVTNLLKLSKPVII